MDMVDLFPTIGPNWQPYRYLSVQVRLKRYLEMRGADGGPWRRLCALPAFWVCLASFFFLPFEQFAFGFKCTLSPCQGSQLHVCQWLDCYGANSYLYLLWPQGISQRHNYRSLVTAIRALGYMIPRYVYKPNISISDGYNTHMSYRYLILHRYFQDTRLT